MPVSDFVFGLLLGTVLVLIVLSVIGWALWYRKRNYEYTKQQVEDIVDKRLAQSRSKIKGDIAENIAPHMKEFIEKYDPADARYLGGKPVDYIVYKGYSQAYDSDKPIEEIVFVEVKTSKEAKRGLDKNEAKIREAINSRRVSYDVITLHYE